MVFDIRADEASAILFGVPLFVVTKMALHSKTWLEHCIPTRRGCMLSVTW